MAVAMGVEGPRKAIDREHGAERGRRGGWLAYGHPIVKAGRGARSALAESVPRPMTVSVAVSVAASASVSVTVAVTGMGGRGADCHLAAVPSGRTAVWPCCRITVCRQDPGAHSR
jgi:hypothetical protein